MGGCKHLALLDGFDCLAPGTAGLHAFGEIPLDDGYAAAVGLGFGQFSHVAILANVRSDGEYPPKSALENRDEEPRRYSAPR